MFKKIITVILLSIIIISVFPNVSFAADVSIEIDGTYNIRNYGNNSLITIRSGLNVTLINTGGMYTNLQIECEENVNLTINSLQIDNSGYQHSCPLSFRGNNNTLTLVGNSDLNSGDYVPGIAVYNDTVLEIKGTGALRVRGGGSAAGIGGGAADHPGTIIISGGNIDCYGGAENAGIGGGSYGSITISGGVVTATGGTCNQGIGSNEGTVNITGGYVYAFGDQDGAGIGGGSGSDGGTIHITGGTIEATGGMYGAAIGGGLQADGGNILIEGGTITAISGADTGGYGTAAGIGGGAEGNGGEITISGGTVRAKSCEGGAGIGGGIRGNGGIITISGGTVFSEGSDGAFDIGPGNNAADEGSLSISGESAVLLRNGTLPDPTTSSHALFTADTVTDHTAFGYTLPDSWTAPVYAYLECTMYELNYNANEGTGTIPSAVKGIENSTIEVEQGSGLTNGEKIFWKWNTEPNGSGTDYFPGGEFVFTDDTVLYALYRSPVPVSSVTLSSSSETIMRDHTVKLTAAVLPEEADYNEITWTSDDELVATVDQNGLVTAVSLGNTVIRAAAEDKYDECEITVVLKQCTVTFNTQGGDEVPNETVQENGHVTDPGIPTRTGYSFNGWYKEQACLNPWNFNTDTVTTDITLWAEWTQDSAFFSGSGTAANPYRIITSGDLAQLATVVNAGNTAYNNKYYIQTQNIDLSGYANWTPIGDYAPTPVKPFKGTYDGNGKDITSLNINITPGSSTVYKGLFGYIQGTVKNINLKNGSISITNTSAIYAGGIVGYMGSGLIDNCKSSININAITTATSGRVSAGGIAGGSNDSCIVSNCVNSGNIQGSSNYETFIGGIIGYIDGGTQVSSCSNFGDILGKNYTAAGGIAGFASEFISQAPSIRQSFNIGDVTVDNLNKTGYSGGIIGNASSDTEISNCYNAGNISDKDDSYSAYVGGIAGRDGDGSGINYCYNIGAISGDGQPAGIVGIKSSSGSLVYCYYADTCSVGIGSGSGTTYKKTLAQMRQQATYTGFNFSTVWDMSSAAETGYSFPQLQQNLLNAFHNVELTANGEQGTVEGTGEYGFLDTVTITAEPKSRYAFKNWAVSSGGVTLANASNSETTFSMPFNDVSINAVFEPSKYNLTLTNDGHGTASVGGSYSWGSTVSITATANSSYQFMSWQVVSGGAVIADEYDMTTSFIMPESNVTIKAIFGPNPTGYTVAISNETATITGTSSSVSGAVEIPNRINGYWVTGIGTQALRNKTSITSIQIPDTVRVLHSSAFNGCTNLETVDFGNGVTEINGWAFYECTSLTSLKIPDSVLMIADAAFEGCTNLSEVTIGKGTQSIGLGILRNCPKVVKITVSADNGFYKSVDDVLYNISGSKLICYPVGKLGGFSIPEGVTTIDDYAFYKGTLLTSIEIPGAVTKIGKNAFQDCTALTSVTLPDELEIIDNYAFADCSELSSIDIPDSVITIGSGAFYNCVELTEAYFKGQQPSFGSSVFYNVGSGFKVYYHISKVTNWATFEPSIKQPYMVLTKDLRNGQGPEKSIVKLVNFKIPQPQAPEWEGHTFIGWYKDEACLDDWDFNNDVPADDVTLYAKWSLDHYTITAVLNNTSFGTVTGGGSYSGEDTAVLRATPKDGCRFMHWMEGLSVVTTDAVYTFTPKSDRTLKAYFTQIGTPLISSITYPAYNTVELSWNALGGVTGYEVYRATSSGGTYTRIGTSADASYTDTVPQLGKTYYYKVRAYCTATTATTYGSYSGIKSAKPVWATITLTATPQHYNSVDLSWNEIDDADFYQVWRSTSSSGTYTQVGGNMTERSYTDTGLTAGKTYYYKVRAADENSGNPVYGPYSSYQYAKPNWDTIALTATTQHYNIADLSWNEIDDADFYQVWRSTSSSGTYIQVGGNMTEHSYTDTGLTAGKTYYYKVRPADENGGNPVYGPYCSYKYAKPNWITPALTAERQYYHSIKLTWDDVRDADRYNIYRCTSSTGTYKLLVSEFNGTEYIDEAADEAAGYTFVNRTFYYKVQPVDTDVTPHAAGTCSSYKSAKASWETLSLTAAQHTYNSVRLSWNKVEDANHYVVYRSTKSSGTYTALPGADNVKVQYYVDESLPMGTTYYYKVQPIDEAIAAPLGTGTPSSYKYVKVGWPKLNLTAATKNYYSVQLSWNAIAEVDKYEIYRSTSYSKGYELIKTLTGVREGTIKHEDDLSGLPVKTYYYMIKPYQGTVAGPYCSYKYAKPAWPKITLAATSGGYNSIKLTWNDILMSEGENDYYDIFRSESSPTKYQNYVHIGSIRRGDGPTITFTDDGSSYPIGGPLTCGKTYYYSIVPNMYIGTTDDVAWGPYCSYKSAKPIPATPTNLKVEKASATSMTITWDAVAGATGYEVYRATSAKGTYSKVATILEPTRTFTNTGLTAGKTYYYKVRAYRQVGSAKVYGSFCLYEFLKLV